MSEPKNAASSAKKSSKPATKGAPSTPIHKPAAAKSAAASTARKTKSPSAPSKPATADHAKGAQAPDAEEEWNPSKTAQLVTRLRARWPSLSAEEQRDLDSLSNDTQRAALGATTKAQGVAGDAARWAASIDRQLNQYALLTEHYHPKRFSYYLLRLEALVAQITRESGRGASKGTARSLEAAALTAAKKARDRLERAVAKTSGTWPSAGGDDVVVAIRKLVEQASGLRKTRSAFLLEIGGLTQACIDEARAAADTLATAGADVTEAGSVTARDSPTVNLLEGWVLEEMKQARDDVDAAREDSPVIERLVPGPATRRVLGNHPKKKATTPAAPAEPDSVAPPAKPA